MKKMAPRMAEVLPKHMDMNRMSRIALTTIRTNPKLLECAVPSLMGAVMQAVQLGLEPGLLGHCYILPYKREATFIIGYKGMIDLARRSGHIQSIYAHAVHENDEFEYELGLHPNSTSPHMEIVARLLVRMQSLILKMVGIKWNSCRKVKLRNAGNVLATANSSYSPWSSDYEEMAKKTVVRYMFKYLPISIEVQTQARKMKWCERILRKSRSLLKWNWKSQRNYLSNKRDYIRKIIEAIIWHRVGMESC